MTNNTPFVLAILALAASPGPAHAAAVGHRHVL
jgi:hypothetical protein